MADEASDTVAGAIKNYLGSLGFIFALLGGEEIVRWALTDSGWPRVGAALMAAALPIYLSPAAWGWLKKKLTDNTPQELAYLHNEDSELGEAIRSMAWRSAWARWFASQSLAMNDHRAASEYSIMQAAASQAMEEMRNGRLEVRGRRPGQLEYEAIPRTHWRSTGLAMIPDNWTLWRAVLIPGGGAEITPEGEVIGRDAAATQRTDQLRTYDSLIVNSRQFEAIWPRRNKVADKARKRLLKTAKKAGADAAEIAKLLRD